MSLGSDFNLMFSPCLIVSFLILFFSTCWGSCLACTQRKGWGKDDRIEPNVQYILWYLQIYFY